MLPTSPHGRGGRKAVLAAMSAGYCERLHVANPEAVWMGRWSTSLAHLLPITFLLISLVDTDYFADTRRGVDRNLVWDFGQKGVNWTYS